MAERAEVHRTPSTLKRDSTSGPSRKRSRTAAPSWKEGHYAFALSLGGCCNGSGAGTLERKLPDCPLSRSSDLGCRVAVDHSETVKECKKAADGSPALFARVLRVSSVPGVVPLRSPSACQPRFSELPRSLVCSMSGAVVHHSCNTRKSTSSRSKSCDLVRRRVCTMRDDGCKGGPFRRDF